MCEVVGRCVLVVAGVAWTRGPPEDDPTTLGCADDDNVIGTATLGIDLLLSGCTGSGSMLTAPTRGAFGFLEFLPGAANG